jgi:N-acetylmuramoyl-L-alanine amidase
VTLDHQAAIDAATRAVTASEGTVASTQSSLDGEQARAAAAAAQEAAAQAQLFADQSALTVAAAANQAAQARVAADRKRLRGLALEVYTGAVTGPQPAAMQTLAADQQAATGRAEFGAVAEVTVSNLHSDVTGAAAAARNWRRSTRTVAADEQDLSAAQTASAAAAALIPPTLADLATARQHLARARHQLARAQAALQVALAALGPRAGAAGAGLSLLGGAALDAKQLTAWFNAQGYFDATTTPISKLAVWYLQIGALEGLRGDVAFAQAVLETGGFSSPDAVLLNNYAGIGHCDTCAAGWAFPSARAGVIGQMQLLRLFADGGPAPKAAPPPVLPALAPARLSHRGCCQTWEALTGVWASDPSYGIEILSLYQDMLAYASGPGEPAQPATSPAPGQLASR